MQNTLPDPLNIKHTLNAPVANVWTALTDIAELDRDTLKKFVEA